MVNKFQPSVKIEEALKLCKSNEFGVVNQSFLCRSVGYLEPASPVCVIESTPLNEVITILQNHKIGCVLVNSEDGKLIGIFTERDCLLKVINKGLDLTNIKVSEVMTKEPMTITMDETIAYALNLMSLGGFRHVPILDTDNVAVGIISVKDVMDKIVTQFVEDLMNFQM